MGLFAKMGTWLLAGRIRTLLLASHLVLIVFFKIGCIADPFDWVSRGTDSSNMLNFDFRTDLDHKFGLCSLEAHSEPSSPKKGLVRCIFYL